MSWPRSLDDNNVDEAGQASRQQTPTVQWSEPQHVSYPSRTHSRETMAFSTPAFDRATSGIGGFGNPRPARVAASHSLPVAAGDLAPSSGILKPSVTAPLKQTGTAQPAAPVTPQKTQLLTHIQRSLLTGDCADICLRIERWGVVYHLHRMVLVQAGEVCAQQRRPDNGMLTTSCDRLLSLPLPGRLLRVGEPSAPGSASPIIATQQ